MLRRKAGLLLCALLLTMPVVASADYVHNDPKQAMLDESCRGAAFQVLSERFEDAKIVADWLPVFDSIEELNLTVVIFAEVKFQAKLGETTGALACYFLEHKTPPKYVSFVFAPGGLPGDTKNPIAEYLPKVQPIVLQSLLASPSIATGN